MYMLQCKGCQMGQSSGVCPVEGGDCILEVSILNSNDD